MASKKTPLKAALEAGEAAAKAATGKSKADILKKVANAATEAAIGEKAPPPLVAQCVAEAIKKAGGSKHEAVVAAASAAVCSHPGLSRVQMTEEVFHRWDADKGGTLEFEEIIGHYMGASNHTDSKEAQVRAGFEKFIVKHGKKKGDSMDMTLFKKWMGSATMLQVTFQYLQSLSADESEKLGFSVAAIAKAAAAAATAAGGDANVVADEAVAVAMKLKASAADVAKASAIAAASAGASDDELAKISEAASAKAGGSKEDAKKASLAAIEDIKANPAAIKKALAAGKKASEAAKSKPKAQMLKAVADAATQAAMAEGASQPIVAQAVAEAIKKAGGTPHEAVTAAANAAVCAHAGLSREQMTEAVFHRWDDDQSGTLEFEEIIGHYMGASNHSDAKEAQVRAGFEKFIVKNGKQKGDPMDMVLFKKWMNAATVLQVTFQYLQSLDTDEAEALGASASMIAQAAAAAAKAAGGDADATADEAAAVAMKLKASPSEVATASAKAASSVGATEEQCLKIAAGAIQKAGGSKEDLDTVTVAVKSYAAVTPTKGTAPAKPAEVAKKATPPAAAVKAPSEEKTADKKKTEEQAKATEAAKAANVPKPAGVVPIALKDLSTSEMKQEFEERFMKLFDKHSAGKDALSSAQVQAFISKLPPKSQTALGIKGWKGYLKEADLDGDGKLDRFEFQVFNTHRAMEVADEYVSLFEKSDADKDGYLTKEALAKNPAILKKLNFPNAQAMLQKVDKDGDGKISQAELMHHVMDLLTAEGSASQDDQANSKRRASVTDHQPPAKRQKTADQTSAPEGKRQVALSDDGNKCWDFMAGCCFRGENCHYVHDQASRVSDSELEAHRASCNAAAEAAGLKLSKEALLELQTLEEGDAVSLIDSLAKSTKNANVRDKNDHLIHQARKKRAMDGKTEHPDWAWFGKGKGKGKRRRQA